MAMESVSVATLKSNLSQYLAAVRRGKEIIVTSHRHPIARIVPVEKSFEDDLKIIPGKIRYRCSRKLRGSSCHSTRWTFCSKTGGDGEGFCSARKHLKTSLSKMFVGSQRVTYPQFAHQRKACAIGE